MILSPKHVHMIDLSARKSKPLTADKKAPLVEFVDPMNQAEKFAAFGGIGRASDQSADAAGDSPPLCNTGGTSEAVLYAIGLKNRNQQQKEKLFKRALDGIAFIDTLTFTLSEDVFIPDTEMPEPEVIANNISAFLYSIFGFGLVAKCNGLHGYQISFLMGQANAEYGRAAFWGNKNSVYINLTGLGLTMAADGWEERLYDFFQTHAPNAKITRIDLSHDFLNGEYSIDQCFQDWQDGKFKHKFSAKNPVAEQHGTDWLNGTKTGRTLYIGSAKSDKRLMAYEKGKQLGDPNSPWVRLELRMRNHKLTLPHEMLINPSPFFVGSYDVINDIFSNYNVKTDKPAVKQKKKDLGILHVTKYAKMQVSPALKLLTEELGLTKEQAFDSLFNERCKMPKRLLKDGLTDSHEMMYFHEFGRLPQSIEDMVRIYKIDMVRSTDKPHWMTDEEYQRYHPENIITDQDTQDDYFDFTKPLANPIGAKNVNSAMHLTQHH